MVARFLICRTNKKYRRMAASSDFLLVTLESIPNKSVERVIGIVSATTNSATHSQSFLHFMENEAAARVEATKLLQKKAQEAGANAVLGLRYNDHLHTLGSDGETCSYFSLITAYGTAVVLKSE